MWLEVVGWAGSALLVWSLLQSRILRLRVINLAGCVVLVGYNWANEVWPMLGLNVVLGVINTWQLRKLVTSRHDPSAFDVVEVDPAGPLLQRLLARHHDDIQRFNPDVDLGAMAGAHLALVVMRGDEVVGMVVARDRGSGVAQVVLDYVTPSYRDFAPGEFVFRQSGIFAARGFTRVVTPPGMVSPYYARLGFEPDGPSYALRVGGS